MILPAAVIDHTRLQATTTADDIRVLCEEAVEYGFRAVCIPPIYVPLARELLYGSETEIATVVGFPLGYVTPAQKVFETAEAVRCGATEIDMVISIAAALEARYADVANEIGAVVVAARNARVKVIFECCYLDSEQKENLVEAAVTAGADFIKTSTGFAGGGATLADVELLVNRARGRVAVKAAGGIRDWATCQAMLAAGATRIGSSNSVQIVREWLQEKGE